MHFKATRESVRPLQPMGKTVSAAWVKGVRQMLESVGLDVGALFADAGLDIGLLDHADARYASNAVSALWTLAALRSQNPAIGLALPNTAIPSMFGAIAYSMMSSENLFAALERFARFVHILTDGGSMALVAENDGYWISTRLCADDGNLVPRQWMDFHMMSLHNFCRWITRDRVAASVVEMAYPLPHDVAPYVDAYQCPIRFDAPQNRMFFSTAILAEPLPTSNPMLAALHDRYAEERLDLLGRSTISYKARELVLSRLKHGEPLKSDIATALFMSERTLQRRLYDEGVSYQQIVDDTRRTLVREYLGKHHLSITQAAHLLGFADQSALTRACKRWFCMSPRQYRDHQLVEQRNRADAHGPGARGAPADGQARHRTGGAHPQAAVTVCA
jgi:AraC-like DNA-binding protein